MTCVKYEQFENEYSLIEFTDDGIVIDVKEGKKREILNPLYFLFFEIKPEKSFGKKLKLNEFEIANSNFS